MNNNITENNYGTYTRDVQLKIDEIFAEKVIPANDSVRLLDQIVEEMEKAPLERALKRTGRGHRTNPIAMLKVILYSAMEHKYGSRSMEASCVRDNILFLD